MIDLETPRTVTIERVMKIRWDKLPEWARFIAQDSNGDIWMYANAPKRNHRCHMWDVSQGQCEKLPELAVKDWSHSLQERPKNA
jgi:glutamate formiminotransferase